MRSAWPTGGFAGRLDPSEQAAMALLGRWLQVPAGAILMFEGEPPDRVMVLLSGHAKLSRVACGRREVLLELRGPGDILGEFAAAGPAALDATVTALGPVEVLVIARAGFTALVGRSPGVARAVLGVVSERCAELSRRHALLSSLDTTGQVASILLELTERYGQPCGEGVEIDLPIGQDEIVAWSRASRAGVCKALQTMRQLGWVRTHRRRIVVLDAAALQRRLV